MRWPSLVPAVLFVLPIAFAAGACGSDGGKDAVPDVPADLPADVPGEAVAELPPDADADVPADLPPESPGGDLPATDESPEAAADAIDDAPGDAPQDPGPPEGLPSSLPFAFTRPDAGEPLTEAEIAAFTRKVLGFLQQVRYFDYVLYTTHGVDASTGKRDWQFWYNERFRKEGDLVTFHHPVNLNDGGHNLHIPMSRVLGDAIAAALVTGDATATRAATQLCKGMSASMLGMVYDADDPLPHLMARNVVPAWNQEFTTHDGRRKAVDTSGWWSEYTRWNCDRFEYADNPHWGAMWVTNLRSKDDVPHIFRLVPILRYAERDTTDAAMKEACGETLSMLTAFAKDIVDSDYRIRTKDENGEVYIAGYTGDPETDSNQGDIATFTWWRDLIPNGECNARRGAELIGYSRAVAEDCGRGEPNEYDMLAFAGNAYNKRICRYFHLAHLANALASRDGAAEALMDGLDQRMAQEEALPEAEMKYTPAVYRRDLALYLAQSHAFGYPLTWDEARMVQDHYARAVDRLASWPYWDPWAPSVPDGELGAYRPPSCEGEGDAQACWFSSEDLAQLFETCWSPLVNPAGARWVDCDIVRDPSRWARPAP